jgi:hypothetical protein
MGIGPIPFTSIVEYFRIFCEGESLEDFLYFIRRMDKVYLDLEGSKQKRSNSGKPAAKTDNHKGPVKR